jgi:CheY-like chemotaxis protein
VATQILAIDDSATMQKILEITFAGTDYQLTVVGSGDEGVAKASGGGYALAICDNSLDPSGYDVAARLKQAGLPVLFLSSRQNPYDAGQGAGAGVDDHIDKPFDTQQLIDRVTKLVGGAGASAGAPAPAATPAPAPAATPAPAPAPAAARPAAGFGAQPARGVAPAPAAAPKVSGFGAQPARAAAPAPAAAPAARTPAPAAAAPAPAARPAAAVAAVSSAIDGQLGAKLGEMGLTPQQAEAVAALSREVVERVVWEVVPVLAETLIREEILRLTK